VSALASGNETVISYIAKDAGDVLSDDAIKAVKAANAIMGMNNIYYRFLSLVSDESYSTLPAKLRMNIISNPGVEKVDFELWSIAVSAINGCQKCVVAHEKQLVSEGLTKDQILTAVRIASVVHGISSVLSSEIETSGTVSRAA
jgi:alkyl hydroperoxide reductase subunit D